LQRLRLHCCSKGIAPRSAAVLAALIARHNTDMPGIPFGCAVWLLCSMSIFQNGQEVNLDEFDDGQPLEVPRGSAEEGDSGGDADGSDNGVDEDGDEGGDEDGDEDGEGDDESRKPWYPPGADVNSSEDQEFGIDLEDHFWKPARLAGKSEQVRWCLFAVACACVGSYIVWLAGGLRS
jgi:hypothetical protein